MYLIDHLITLGLSKKDAQQHLKNGKVFLCGIPTSDGRRDIDPKDVTFLPRAPKMVPNRDPAIVHKDKGFVVVYKPAGYLSVRAAHRHKDPTVMGFVHRICGAALAVHRLDEETSGLMLVATDEETQTKLKEALEKREVSRTYLAIASGHIKTAFTANSTLFRNRGDGKRGSTHTQEKYKDHRNKSKNRDFVARQPQGKQEEGKKAITHIKPLALLQGSTLVQCTLDTGRTHQIRIHLSENKHPVLGDTLYAPKSIQNKSERLALHAHQLTLKHPHTGVSLEFTSQLADDLEILRRSLVPKN